MRTRIKICGITRVEDGLCAAQAGADAIGLVFYPPSPRAVSVARAREVVARLPAFVSVVGLFVDPEVDEVNQVLDQVPLDCLQFHGEESPRFCEGFARPYIKAVRMRGDVDLQEIERAHPLARGLLLDAYQPGVPGGTGTRFDWQRIPPELRGRIILAGGLDADNVARAIAEVGPYAVDVSGGVEAAKGIKDPQQLAAFVAAVKRQDASVETTQ